MTTDWPCEVGRMLTRRSMSLPAAKILIRPSWGRRFSAMSICPMILRRLTIEPRRRRGAESRSIRTPSIRYRMRTRSANGSMWMSEARSETASWMIRWTSRMTGASPSSRVLAPLLVRLPPLPSSLKSIWVSVNSWSMESTDSVSDVVPP